MLLFHFLKSLSLDSLCHVFSLISLKVLALIVAHIQTASSSSSMILTSNPPINKQISQSSFRESFVYVVNKKVKQQFLGRGVTL
jgi:hypothetical protein